jgi:hypothetical protein
MLDLEIYLVDSWIRSFDMKKSLTSVPGDPMPRVLFNKTIISRTPSTPHPGLVLFALLSSFLPFLPYFLLAHSCSIDPRPELKTGDIHTHDTNSQTLPQPVAQLRLTELCQVVHALLAKVDVLQLRDVLGRGAADALDDRALVYRLPVSCVSSGPSLLFSLPRHV